MKKLILLVILILISVPNSFAGLNSSPGEMKYKKKKALSWYEANNKPGMNKELSLLKDRALRWYKKNITAHGNEMNSLKKKSLRWHETNSK